MPKAIIVVLLVLSSIITTPASAQSNCGTAPDLSIEQMKALSTAAWRDYAIKNWEYQICTWRGHYAFPERHRPPADADYVAAMLASFQASLTVIKDRRTIPPVERYLEKLRDPARMEAFGELFTYSMLTQDIYREDNCPVPKQGRYCIPASMLAQLEATGKDGRAEVARMARESRLAPIDPWFLIGSVTVRMDPEAELERGDLKNAQREASEFYNQMKAQRDEAEKKLADAEAATARRIEALNKAPEALAEKIFEITVKAPRDPAVVRANARYRELTDLIEKAEARRATIDERIAYMRRTYPADDRFALDRISDLQTEQATLRERETRWHAERGAMFRPRLSNRDKAELEQLADEYKLARDDVDRRIALERRRLARIGTATETARNRFRAAEVALAVADKALAEWERPKVARIEEILTDDAEIHVVGERGMERLIALNQVIARIETDQRKRWIEMRAAGKVADRAKDAIYGAGYALARAEYTSVLSQATLEALFIAWDVGKAYQAGGPPGALIELVRQQLMLLAFPPSYVTTPTKKGAGKSSSGTNYAALLKALQKSAEQLAKQGASEPFRIFRNISAKGWNAAEAEKQLIKAITDGSPEVYEKIRKHQGNYDEAVKKLAELKEKGAIKKFAGRMGQDLLKGLLKSVVKDYAKQAISDLLAKPEFQAYLEAEFKFNRSLLEYHTKIDNYWFHKTILDSLRHARDLMRQRLDADDGTLTIQNQPFYADPRYAFRFTFAEGTDVADLRMRVTLGSIMLDPSEGDPVWVLPEDANTRFGRDLPEELPLVIQFE